MFNQSNYEFGIFCVFLLVTGKEIYKKSGKKFKEAYFS